MLKVSDLSDSGSCCWIDDGGAICENEVPWNEGVAIYAITFTLVRKSAETTLMKNTNKN